MKLRKTKKNRKKAIIISTVATLLIIAAGLTVFALYKQPDASQSNPEATKKAQETNNEGKKDFIENTNSDGSSTNNGSTSTPSSSVTISAQKESNGSVTVFTKLMSITGGTCTLTVTQGSNKLSKSADVLYQDEYSSCAGFTITMPEATQLGAGDWNINLSVLSGQTSYTGTTNISYKVN
ncbi:MAG: hypothetical protein ABIP50_00860 [Candidatus Saccharimonadales bacterium]